MLLATLYAPARALERHVEDFTTHAFDNASSQAIWDTVQAKLRIPPFQVSSFGSVTVSNAVKVAVSGTRAYVARQSSGFSSYEATYPHALMPLFTYGYLANAIAANDTMVCVASGAGGLRIFDPWGGELPLSTFNTPGSAEGVSIWDTYAFVADGATGLQVVNVANRHAPTDFILYDTPGYACDVVAYDWWAYVADQTAGLQIVSIPDGLIYNYDTPGSALGVARSGDLIYVADGVAGLHVISVANPTSPQLLGTYDTPGTATDVEVIGRLAYVADGASGLLVIDVGNPAAMTLKFSYDTPGTAGGVAVSGNCAFVADGASGLQSVRIGAWGPTILGSCATAGEVRGISAQGDLVALAEGASGVQFVDISNPLAPSVVGTYDSPGFAHDVALSGSYAYVADGLAGLQVVNIFNPAIPVPVGNYNSPGEATAIEVSGTRAYLADDASGLRILSIANPSAPSSIASYNAPGPVHDVAARGRMVLIAHTFPAGIQYLDTWNPSAPTVVASRSYSESVGRVALGENGRLHVVTTSGVEIIESSGAVDNFPIPGGGLSVDAQGKRFLAVGGSPTWGIHLGDLVNSTGLRGGQYTGGLTAIFAGPYVLAATAGTSYGFAVLDPADHEMDVEKRYAASVVWDQPIHVARARLVVAEGNLAHKWELNPAVTPGGSPFVWVYLEDQGYFYWQVLLDPSRSQSVGYPEATRVEIEYEFAAPLIAALTDVPGDQGRRLRLRFSRSGYEGVDSPTPIVGYQVLHRVDDPQLLAEVARQGRAIQPHESAAKPWASFAAGSVRRLGERTFIAGGASNALRDSGHGAPESLPPGLWEATQWVAPVEIPEYLTPVTTDADSTSEQTAWSVYVVTAHTADPTVWFAGAPDSACSVDNLAPNVPSGFTAVFQPGAGYALEWNPSAAPDFRYFRVYRSNDPDFVPGPGFLVHSTTATAWTDSGASGAAYYKLTALDFAGNESAAATTPASVNSPADAAPARFALRALGANPLRGPALLQADFPVPGRVTLAVYDVTGRRVRTLRDGETAAGRLQLGWDARDESGAASPAGLYFVSMRAAGFERVLKLALAR